MIERRSNGNYRVRVYHKSRMVTSRTFQRRKDAVAFELNAKTALAAGKPLQVQPRSDLVTVEDWVGVWLESKAGGKPSAVADRAYVAQNYVVPAFGRLAITMVPHSAVAAWARGLARDRSASVARRALTAARGTFALAVRDGAISDNPALGISLPSVQAGEAKPLTHDQVWAVADAMTSPRDRAMVLVLAYGGLRWGELCALQVGDVSPDRATINVQRAYSDVGGVLYLGDTKTHAQRTVFLPPTVASELDDFISRDAPHTQLLFHGRTPVVALRNSNWRRRNLDPAVEAAGIGRRVRPHELRDTAASLALASGGSLAAVARMLGHRQISTTMHHYLGLLPNESRQLASLLETSMNREQQRRAD